MRKFLSILSFLVIQTLVMGQLKDIKILLPKEVGFSNYEFVQFLPSDKNFVLCAGSLAVYDTETGEIVDEVELIANARNLSVSKDGKLISHTLGNELFIYSFANQKLELIQKVPSIDLLKDIPNGEWYKSVDFSSCFFLNEPGKMYVSIGSFTMIILLNVLLQVIP